jgi:hypothetical protein
MAAQLAASQEGLSSVSKYVTSYGWAAWVRVPVRRGIFLLGTKPRPPLKPAQWYIGTFDAGSSSLGVKRPKL